LIDYDEQVVPLWLVTQFTVEPKDELTFSSGKLILYDVEAVFRVPE